MEAISIILDEFSYIWIYHDWSMCSKTCGKGGTKKQIAGCFRVLNNQGKRPNTGENSLILSRFIGKGIMRFNFCFFNYPSFYNFNVCFVQKT